MSDSTLKVTIEEECFVNGVNLGGRKTITVSNNIRQFTRQIKNTVPNTLSALVKFSPSNEQNTGQYYNSGVRYLRFTNLHTSADAQIHFHGGAVSGNPINAYFSLPANTSMIIFGNKDSSSPGSDKTGVEKSFFVSTSGAGSSSVNLEDIEQINVIADTVLQIETIIAADII